MEDLYSSLSEVNEILKFLPKEDYEKIPEEIIEVIKNNMDKNYKWEYDFSKALTEQDISREAVAILSYINMEYLLTKEQKDLMEEIHKFNEQKIENEKKVKFNPDDIFKNRTTITNELKEKYKNDNVLPIEVRKETLFLKILTKIKNILKLDKINGRKF